MAVHCRPWTSAVLALKLEVGFLAVISTAWLSLADPEATLDRRAPNDRGVRIGDVGRRAEWANLMPYAVGIPSTCCRITAAISAAWLLGRK
jgi:hypothetical protein